MVLQRSALIPAIGPTDTEQAGERQRAGWAASNRAARRGAVGAARRGREARPAFADARFRIGGHRAVRGLVLGGRSLTLLT